MTARPRLLWAAGAFFLCGSLQAATLRVAPVTGPASPVIQAPLGSASVQSGRINALSLSPRSLVPGLLAPALSIPQVQPLVVAPALLPVPMSRPDPKATLPQRLAGLEKGLAAPLAAAADAKTGAGDSYQAGQDIQKVLNGEDLPPAGPMAEFTGAQTDWLHADLVSGPAPLLTEQGFNAFIRKDAAAMAEILPWLKSTPNALPTLLSSIYQALGRVAAAEGLSGSERAVLAQGLNDRFSAALETLSLSPELNPAQRDLFAEVRDRYLRNHAALNELLHHRQAVGTFSALQQRAVSLVAPSEQHQYAEDRWTLQPPLMSNLRGVAPDREERILLGTGETERNIKDWQFYLEKYLSRYRLATQNPRFSQRLREQMTQTLSTFLGRFFQTEGALHSNLERVAGFSLHNSFVNPRAVTARPRRIVWIPDNKNLRLVAEPGGWRVEAAFETDIQDDAVLANVETSIEDYWKGSFESGGRESTFRVVVSVRKLAAGGQFSEGSLRLMDSRGGVSHAMRDTIVLDRNLRYDISAHEFGHILGLADEYREGYDPDLAAAVMLQNHASIMGSPNGKVLPRHFQLAFQLLRRRSLRP